MPAEELLTDLAELKFSEAAPEETSWIEVCRDGRWQHPTYGKVTVDAEMRRQFERNFSDNVRKTVMLAVDYDHKVGPAAGWIVALQNEGPSLKAEVRWTPAAREQVRHGAYRFFSPDWHPKWQDPDTGVQHGATLFGGALTNRPFFRELAPLQASDPGSETGAETPDQEKQMPDELPGGTGQEQFTAAEAQELRTRLQAVEEENGRLRAAEERRGLQFHVEQMRYTFGGRQHYALAPAGREELVDALLDVPQALRARVLGALGKLQWMEFGERGFVAAEPDPNAISDERTKELLEMTPVGQAARKKGA